ncbi:hypothetical protein DFH27DRAFT_608767 [Peziza echinospora]|nr:hypothetical protein DFH27DRAFT_608767 [Peziza echinospora]
MSVGGENTSFGKNISTPFTTFNTRQLSTTARESTQKPKTSKGARVRRLVLIPTAAVITYLVYDHLTTPPLPLLHPRIFTPFTLISRVPASSISNGASCDSAIFTFRADTVTSNPAVDGFFQIPSSWIGRGLLSGNGGWADDGGGGWSSFWNQGLWSVEVKQPMLQIARRYTPLPPLESGPDVSSGRSDHHNELRFFIKREPEGEVSRWLFLLDIGTTVWFRGPGWEWVFPSWLRGVSGAGTGAGNGDMPGQLKPVDGNSGTADNDGEKGSGAGGGGARSIVFLAGGTGIAPALQLAAAVRRLPLSSSSPSPPHRTTTTNLAILWAVRAPGDIPPQIKQYLDTVQAKNVSPGPESAAQGRAGAGGGGGGGVGRIETKYHVDSLGTYITKVDISQALGLNPGDIPPDSPQPIPQTQKQKQGSWTSWFTSSATEEEEAEKPPPSSSSSSSLSSSATPNPTNTQRNIPHENFKKEEDAGSGSGSGDKVILISGPDGFIRYFTGAKMEDGSQGKVSGLVKEIIVASNKQDDGGDHGASSSGSGDDNNGGNRTPKRRRRWFVWKM